MKAPESHGPRASRPPAPMAVAVTLVLHATSTAGCAAPDDRGDNAGPPSRSITIEREVVLGDDHEALVGQAVKLVQSGERYYVNTPALPAEILVFDLGGRFLRSMGRPGEGPGEFSIIEDIDVGPDGNLWIFHAGRELTIIDTLGALVATHPGRWLVGSNGADILPDSTILMNAVVPTPDLVGRWVHAWKPGSGFLWSLDDEVTVYQGLVEIRHVAPYADGFWLAWRTDRFRLLQYTPQGKLVKELRPVRPWFEDFKVTPPPSPLNEGVTDRAKLVWPRPTAGIMDIRLDGPALWVLGTTADQHWEKIYDEGWYDLGQYIDAVVEVYDIASGELLASETFDPAREADTAWAFSAPTPSSLQPATPDRARPKMSPSGTAAGCG